MSHLHRNDLLKLSKQELIKKCKQEGVALTTQNPTKSDLVNGLIDKLQNKNKNKNNKNDDEKKEYSLEHEEDDPNKTIHTKSRKSPYDNTGNDGKIERYELKDSEVKWQNECNDYKPPQYTHSLVLTHKIPDRSEKIIKNDNIKYKFNNLEGNLIDRRSYLGKYQLDENYYNLPLNPIGRTGMRGRGHLWRWGPNHAADPIVTRG
eukprot:528967_1